MEKLKAELVGFIDFFKELPDHRVNRRKLHRVEELLLLTFCGVAAGCDSWNDIELFGKTKLDYLRCYLAYEHGICSDDTLRRFFRALDPIAFETCFTKWVHSLQIELKDKVVAVDGKTSRRSHDGENRPMHLISAFVSEVGISLGQLKTEDKSNEITAIPELLNVLDLEGAIVTIDAMGCQTKIVEKIVEKQADYVIGLKGNQGTLHEDVRLLFKDKPKGCTFEIDSSIDKGHGRLETRHCTISDDIKWLTAQHPDWKDLRSVIEIESHREEKGVCSIEKRYYISSLPADPTKAAKAIREHWGVENRLHWVLDLVFNDDQSRIRKGNAPRNIAIVKKTVLNLLQIIKKTMPRVSLKAMRKLAGWENNFLDKILTTTF